MIRNTLFALALLVAATGPALAADEAAREKAATKAARAWLQKVDDAKYAESWKQSATYFRQSISQSEWERSARAAREPLGRLVSRKPKSATYKTELPGVPDGQYMVIEFQTSFENKKSAVETVTPVLESNGAWKVNGYYIR